MMIQDPHVFRTGAIIKKGLFPLIFDMVLFKEEQGNRKENSCKTIWTAVLARTVEGVLINQEQQK